MGFGKQDSGIKINIPCHHSSRQPIYPTRWDRECVSFTKWKVEGFYTTAFSIHSEHTGTLAPIRFPRAVLRVTTTAAPREGEVIASFDSCQQRFCLEIPSRGGVFCEDFLRRPVAVSKLKRIKPWRNTVLGNLTTFLVFFTHHFSLLLLTK